MTCCFREQLIMKPTLDSVLQVSEKTSELFKKKDKMVEEALPALPKISSMATSLREMYSGGNGLNGGSVDFEDVASPQEVNFELLEFYDVYVESKRPDLIVKPFETSNHVNNSKASTMIVKYNLAKLKFNQLTSIQKYIFPNILFGNTDLLVSAPNGSGKTFAYIASIVQVVTCQVERQTGFSNRTPVALILVPTRELVQQIFNQMMLLTKDTGVRILYLYGGQVNIDKQIEKIKSGLDIIISTPGRFLQLVLAQELALHNLRYIVIDEIDKILFPHPEVNTERRIPLANRISTAADFNQETLEAIYKLFGKSSPQSSKLDKDFLINKELCRLFFFSATIDSQVREESEKYLHPNYVYMVMGNNIKAVNSKIKQVILPCKNYTEKKVELIKLLKSLCTKFSRIVIFVAERVLSDTLSDYLNQNGFTAASIHGNRVQELRERVVQAFRSGKLQLVVATFLMARGIDVEGLNCVINFDFPDCLSEYIHAIGRTGRAGKIGMAISFFNTTLKQDINLINELIKSLEDANQDVPHFLLEMQSNQAS